MIRDENGGGIEKNKNERKRWNYNEECITKGQEVGNIKNKANKQK